jgi:hypothetical protein
VSVSSQRDSERAERPRAPPMTTRSTPRPAARQRPRWRR